MQTVGIQFATASAAQPGLFGSLGIDWKLLLLQTIAFLILLAILRKVVYPPLIAALDKRDKDLRDSAEAAESAHQTADATEKMTAELMRKARAEASDIVAAARDEASQVVEAASQKAAAKAEAIVAAARDDIAKEVATARQQLHDQTLELVTEATGTVLRQKITSKTDARLIADAIKEAE